MKEIKNQRYTEERALFFEKGAQVKDSVFADGESPLKHSEDIRLSHIVFESRYPIWYSKNIEVSDSAFFKTCRAGIWYTDHITLRHTVIDAPKCIRRSSDVILEDVNISSAVETLWDCKDIRLKDVSVANGDYFAMNCENMEVENLQLVGQYVFDGVKNVTIKNSRMLTKDAFWNSENVTVRDSFISGEYLGWNAKNLTLINCTLKSLQGFCYIDNLVMKNCTLVDTTLAFEYSNVDVELNGTVDSVFNPSSGIIKADAIGELTMDQNYIDPDKTKIILP